MSRYPTPHHSTRLPIYLAFGLAAVMIVLALFIAGQRPAHGDIPDHVTQWHAPDMAGGVSCDFATNTQTANVRATNVEGETATVRVSTGPIFTVGDTIPAHSFKVEHFNRPGTFVGTIVVRFSVNYPSDHTLRESSISLRFPGGCVMPTTTTTAPPPTTTTTGPPPTEPPTSILPPTTEVAPPAGAVTTTAAFTG